MLYQRYFLRMNQSNTTHLISLLLVLVISLAAVHLTFILLYSSNYIHQQKTTHRNQSLKQTINDSVSFNDNNEFINFDTQNGNINNNYNNNSISATYQISGNSNGSYNSTINNKIDEQKLNLFTSENNIFIEMTHHGFNDVDNNYQNDYGAGDEDKIEDESINFNHNSKTEFNYDSKMSHPYGRYVI